MKRSDLFRVTMATALLFSVFASTLLVTSVAAAPIGCFFFTDTGVKDGTTHCNLKANDLTVLFVAGGPNCVLVGGLGTTEPCPKVANNVDVAWGVSSTGATVILGCHWTEGKRIIATCPLEGSTNFILENAVIKEAIWTFDGSNLPHPVKVGADFENGVQFSLK
jgi:hypothetical protein